MTSDDGSGSRGPTSTIPDPGVEPNQAKPAPPGSTIPDPEAPPRPSAFADTPTTPAGPGELPEGKRATKDQLPAGDATPVSNQATMLDRPLRMGGSAAETLAEASLPGDTRGDADSSPASVFDAGPTEVSTGRLRPLSPPAALPPPSLERTKWIALGLAGIAAVLLLWSLVSRPGSPQTDVSPLQALPRPTQAAPLKEAGHAAVEPPQADVVWIEQWVDAGAGYARLERRAACLVSLTSEPMTEVSLEGGVLGTTPVLITLPVGSATLTFENRTLGLRRKVTFDVPEAQRASRSFRFERGWLEIDVRTGTSVSVDGRAVGIAPIAPISLFEGPHTVDLAWAVGGHHAGVAEVRANQTATYLVSEPKPAE